MKFLEYNENKKHGTNEFPLGYYYVTESHFRYDMPLHCHNEFEIIRVLAGEFCLNLNGVLHRLKKGDFAMIESMTLHSGIPSNAVYECVVFDLNMLKTKNNDFTDRYISPMVQGKSGVICKVVNSGSRVGEVLNRLFEEIVGHCPFYELKIMGILCELFYTLYSRGEITPLQNKSKNTGQIEKMTELLDWISTHYAESITLADLSKISGFSEKYLCRIFREYTFKTPIDYINQMRIENACRDILYSNKSITDIAFANGYNNTSYFSRMFKQLTGCTPREYKKKRM